MQSATILLFRGHFICVVKYARTTFIYGMEMPNMSGDM